MIVDKLIFHFNKLLFFFCFIILNTNIIAEVWVPVSKLYQKNQRSFSYKLGYYETGGKNDTYLYFEPKLNLNQKNWGFSILYPFYFLAYDRTPQDTNGTGLGIQTTLRQSQEKNKEIEQDYLKTVDYFWFGNYDYFISNRLTYLFFFGQISNGNLGHGSIFSRYINNAIEQNTSNIGLQASLHYRFLSIEMIANSVKKADIYGSRISINPLFFVNRLSNSFKNYSDVSLGFFVSNVADDVGRPSVNDEMSNELPYSSNAMLDASDPDERERAQKEFQQWLRKNDFLEEEEELEASSNNSNSVFRGRRFWWNKLFFGYTHAQDGNAPLMLQYDTTGKVIVDEKTKNPKIDSSNNLKIEGYDIEYYAFTSDTVSLLPYCDQNRIYQVKNSRGTHCGFKVELGKSYFNLTLKSEYRRFSASYIPSYFDSFYESERYQYKVIDTDSTSSYLLLADYIRTGKLPTVSDFTTNSELRRVLTLLQNNNNTTTNSSNNLQQAFIRQRQNQEIEEGQYNSYFTPKFQHLKDIDIEVEDDKVGSGHMLVFNFYDIAIHSFYENYDGKYNSSVFLGVYMPLGPIFISGYYAKRGFESIREAFNVDNKSVLSAEAGLNIFGFGSLKYVIKRYWFYNENTSSFESRENKSIHFSQTIRF